MVAFFTLFAVPVLYTERFSSGDLAGLKDVDGFGGSRPVQLQQAAARAASICGLPTARVSDACTRRPCWARASPGADDRYADALARFESRSGRSTRSERDSKRASGQ